MKVLNFNDPYVDRKGDVNNLGDVLTDTIYDDTEVKESIAKLNSNLDLLEYGENSGGRNIFQLNKIKCGTIVGNNLVLEHQIGEFYEYNWKPNTQYTVSFVGRNSTSNGHQRLYFKYTDGSDGAAITNEGTSFDYVYATSEVGKTIKSINSYWGDTGSLIIKDAEIMIEEGAQATPYKPHIPSVKMLEDDLGGFSLSASGTILTITNGENTWTLNANS